jgi:hypothetical protein
VRPLGFQFGNQPLGHFLAEVSDRHKVSLTEKIYRNLFYTIDFEGYGLDHRIIILKDGGIFYLNDRVA